TLWQSQHACAACCAQCAVAIDGDLDVGRLQAALQRIVDRHQILRTAFRSAPGAGMPIQVVGRGGLEWREIDVRAAGAAGEATAIDRQMEEDGRTAFDLIQGPLLRTHLLCFGPSRHVLMLCLPPLCTDSRTLANLVTEMRWGYEGALGGEVLQYAEYSD